MFRPTGIIALIGFFVVSCNNEEQTSPPAPAQPSEQMVMDSLTTQISVAKNFQEKGQYEKALAIVTPMLQRYPGQLDALGIKSEILKAQGKNAEALALLERAYAMQPRDKETVYNLAYEYAEAKHPRAVSLTDTLIKHDKTETVARAWYIRATYFRNLGNEKEALRYYDSSNIADIQFLDTYLDKGQLLYKKKRYEEALKTFALGQKVSPATPDFYFWVAKCQEAKGDKTNAKMNYEKAYSLDKSFTEAKEAAERL